MSPPAGITDAGYSPDAGYNPDRDRAVAGIADPGEVVPRAGITNAGYSTDAGYNLRVGIAL